MNEVCKEIAELNMSGNIIPIVWFDNIRYETEQRKNKAYLLAILILSDIVYWYKPYEIRDEQTNKIIEYKQKFSADKLQKSYSQYADFFGSTKIAVKRAFDFLAEFPLIIREFRDITVNHKRLTNVMYIEPIPRNIKLITTSLQKSKEVKKSKHPPYKKVDTYTEITHSENSHEFKKLKIKKGEQKGYFQYVNKLRKLADRFRNFNKPLVLKFENKLYDFEYQEDGNHLLRNANSKKVLSKSDAETIYKILNHRQIIPIQENINIGETL
ncbi:MAG: hypothetical protein WA916_07375 [Arcobacter sp.]|uniref:hypothetical protein n=1 Tax=Arcobacter sp. TaxID=1872629 RepID=UPI003C747EFA